MAGIAGLTRCFQKLLSYGHIVTTSTCPRHARRVLSRCSIPGYPDAQTTPLRELLSRGRGGLSHREAKKKPATPKRSGHGKFNGALEQRH
jgi:hypothetical protein